MSTQTNKVNYVVPGCSVPPLCKHVVMELCHCGQMHHRRTDRACHHWDGPNACQHGPEVWTNNECNVCGAHWLCETDAQNCTHHPWYGGWKIAAGTYTPPPDVKPMPDANA